MKKTFSKLCSMLLVICMVVNMMPASAFAVDQEEVVKVPEVSEAVTEELQQPVEEIVEERTEYTKTFRMDNGLYMAAVYPEAVHYEENGEWKEIDNTLRSSTQRSKLGYTNTAGVWDVYFPQELEQGAPISITKDGYQLTFGLAGELNQEQELSASKEVSTFRLSGDEEVYEVEQVKKTPARIQEMDWTERKNSVEHEETVLEKLSSELCYEEIYDNTDITYGLSSNRVKESIVIKEYSETLRGYNYTLETGTMIPILQEGGQIDFYNETKTEVIMSMPAPFLVDSEEEYNYDIKIELVGEKGSYTLSYFLPLDWLADETRAWPVILDPIVNADLNTNNILDRTIAQSYTYSETDGGLECGYRNGRGLERIFLQYANIPALKGSEIVVRAEIQLYKPQTSTGSPIVEVHKVNGSWNSSTITWANQPAHDSLVEDYCVVSGAGHFYWDVTDIVRGWYTNGNTGMMFKVPTSVEAVASTSWEQFWSSDYSEYHDQKPTLYISYRHNNGIEPYYSYQTMSAGHAGTAYIADATGQLKVVKNIAEYSSTINPFSMNLVYNSDYFAVNQSATDTIQGTHGIDMYFGNGFTLDIIETIESANIANAYGSYLVHHDGDGTDHYFAKQADGTYKDEDGLGLTVTISGSDQIMTDDQGNTKVFKSGLLTEIKDEVGNKIWFHYYRHYEKPWFFDIYQKNVGCADKKIATVTYKEGTSYIDSLTDAAGRTYTFTYLDNRLSTISLDGTAIAEYAYVGNRLVGMKDKESDYQLWFTYENGKVATIQEWIGYEEGAIVGVTYRNESTMYVDYGADRTRGTGDDTATYYALDYAGRTVNACTTNSKGQVVGATNAVYSGTGATENVRLNNRTQSTANVGKAGQNMLSNGSFESGLTGWTVTGVGSVANSSVTANASEGMQHSGTLALMGYMPPTSSGTIGAYTQKTLKAGTTYTFSGYLQTYYISSSNWRLYLKVEAPDGTTWYSGDVNQYMGTTWMRQSVTFTAPTNGNYKLYVCGEDAYRWFYADDFQLEVGEAPTGYNLISNGDFYDGQQNWYVQGGGCSASNGNTFVRIVGSPSANCYAWQDITVNLPGTETYVLSGWAWADSVPDNVDTVSAENYAQDETKRFGLQAILIYTDGTKEYHYVPFCADVSYWQYASLTIVPKQPTKKVSRIQPVCAYEKNANVAWFDDISLVREDAQTMRYDTEGKLVSVSSTGLKEQTSTYQNGNLIQAYTGGNGTFNYTYDTTYKHRLTSVNNGIVKQSLSYDSFGNVTSTTLQHMSLESSMSTSATYSSDGNRITSMTDTAGNTATYEYSGNLSTALALPTTVTDPKGIKNYYTYDGFGRVKKNSLENLTEIEYDYSKGQVGKITRSGTGVSDQTYEFAYDIWGNRTSVSVGERQLATYTYGAKNGNLTAMNYGNGDGISYTYDEFGRVKTSTYSDGRVLTYTYTGEGVLYSVHDSLAEQTRYYNYDSMNRLQDVQTEDLLAGYEYDAYNHLTGFWFKSKTLGRGNETYTYNTNSSDAISDGLLTQMQMVDGNKIAYSYDRYQRMFQRHINSEREGGGFWEGYSYKDGSTSGSSTEVISEKRNWIDNNTKAHEFLYTYDANGNILTEQDIVNNTSVTYTYDSQNQLLSAIYGDGREEIYTYDAVGNILTFNNGVHSHIYTYGDADWKDLLTALDGHGLTYDEIGNPLTYYNGEDYTMTWMEGRKLQTVTVDNQTITYEYDYSGNRSKKTNDDGSYIKYYIVDGRTVGEVQFDANGTPTLYVRYTFDEAGSVIGYSLWYEGDTDWTHYYFLKNLQGDIIQIYEGSSNELVAEYTYDSWGNVISATGELAEFNPFRYRGYYYDVETGLYYVSSRYYDPEIGRWINADNNFSNYNLFMYCGNNPVNRIDPNGEHWYYLWIDDLIEAGDELMASVSNIVYGRAAYERSYYDLKGANDLWNSRPFQDTKPSQEMQIFTEFMYDHDFVADISVSVDTPIKNTYVKVGASKVLSPNKNIDASYVHAGIGASTPSVLPINISYSVGIVKGVNAKENYAKHFLDIGAGAIYGFDYCWWPNGASAYSFTIGTSYGVYGGYDYYWCLY